MIFVKNINWNHGENDWCNYDLWQETIEITEKMIDVITICDKRQLKSWRKWLM